jgi:uncharacterized protein YndB with AHSA1/START domain
MSTPIGALAVRRSVWIDATQERVWEEFTTFERFSAWFGTGHEVVTYEPWEGGWVEIDCGPVDETHPTGPGNPSRFGGRVLGFDPPNELTFEDAWIPDIGWDAPMLLTLRLTPHLGGTHVELFVHGFEHLGPTGTRAHRGYEGGWTTLQLNNLKSLVEASGEIQP